MRTPIRNMVIGLLLVLGLESHGQSVLDDYIAQGIENNLVLQQKNIRLEQALLGLKIARGMFAPSVALLANYTSGDGGRNIAIPVGDLLNPVYATLNELTSSSQFPQIENVNQNFFPRDFYDVRARASMPLVNTDLIYNKRIRAQETVLQELEVQSYQRELVRQIKTAYFNYLSARAGLAIYQSALSRAEEGRRVNESLLANGRGLPAYVLRSQSEWEAIRAQITDAEQQVENAQWYFNFLLNRELTAEIRTDYSPELILATVPERLVSPAGQLVREELKQIQTLGQLQQSRLSMAQLFWAPRLSGFLDAGAQSENMLYNRQANYYLFGFQFEMPLFAGFTNRHKISQTQLDVRKTQLEFTQVQQQLSLAARMARNSLMSAYQNYQSAQKQLEAAQSYQRLVEKGYKEGVNTFIEAIDARNQLTGAQLLVNVNQYQVLIAEAHLERELATYPLKK